MNSMLVQILSESGMTKTAAKEVVGKLNTAVSDKMDAMQDGETLNFSGGLVRVVSEKKAAKEYICQLPKSKGKKTTVAAHIHLTAKVTKPKQRQFNVK